MNKILLFLLTTIYLFGNEVNEHKIDLFFGNGIDTSYQEAKKVTKKLNGVVKKIYFMNGVNDLINNQDSQEFEVDGTKPVKVEVKIYDMYKGTFLVKNYSTQIVY